MGKYLYLLLIIGLFSNVNAVQNWQDIEGLKSSKDLEEWRSLDYNYLDEYSFIRKCLAIGVTPTEVKEWKKAGILDCHHIEKEQKNGFQTASDYLSHQNTRSNILTFIPIGIILFIVFMIIKNNKETKRRYLESLPKCANCKQPLDPENKTYTEKLKETKNLPVKYIKFHDDLAYKEEYEESTYIIHCNNCSHEVEEKRIELIKRTLVTQCPQCGKESNVEKENGEIIKYKGICKNCNISWYSEYTEKRKPKPEPKPRPKPKEKEKAEPKPKPEKKQKTIMSVQKSGKVHCLIKYSDRSTGVVPGEEIINWTSNSVTTSTTSQAGKIIRTYDLNRRLINTQYGK